MHNIIFSHVTGRYGAFGTIEGNPRQTETDAVRFKHLDLTLADDQLKSRREKPPDGTRYDQRPPGRPLNPAARGMVWHESSRSRRRIQDLSWISRLDH
ncbi:MAG TPA: hypothetical protein VG710_08615 [Opitutus sp.]|nr:hypothetical protein [Opitutus sp.]